MSELSRSSARQPVLRRYILSWTLGVVIVVWLVLVAVAWSTGFREARKFSDGQMVGVAKLWMEASPTGVLKNTAPQPSGIDHEYLQEVAVLAWEDGRLRADTHHLAPGLDLDRLPTEGFSSVQYRSAEREAEWRAYGVQLNQGGHERRVVVLMDLKERYELGQDIAKHVAQPALLVLPLVTLLLWWTIRRGLRPLDQLSSEVAALDGFAGQRLETQHRFSEFTSTVLAINTLVDTLQQQAQREREFASDVAHELRTPLAALALQARAAQADPSPDRLARLEQESLRAGRILTQLLDLARAQRTDNGDRSNLLTAHEVSLGDVASRLISNHAQLAYETGHELSLQQPQTVVKVSVPPMLLELALRNLIENAVRHTPRYTQVNVEVWDDGSACGVSVSDDGQRAGAGQAEESRSAGLGLGLRLVGRIAEQMGATLVRDTGEAPMTTRFALRWPR